MEIVTSILGSIARKITDHLPHATGRRLGYLLYYNDNIEALKKQYQKIRDIRASIQVKIDAAERNVESILPHVQEWISEVDNLSVEIERFLEDEVKANRRCFKGWCIDLRSYYRFSKVAKQKTQAIFQLQKDGKFQNVSYPVPLPRIIFSPTRFSKKFESRESIKKEIIEALNDDRVSVIGICGMVGVGKTTLVKEIGKQAEEGKLYDAVVMTVVSQTPSIHKIQGDIANMLGLTLSSDSFEAARTRLLWDRIKDEKRILVILDDIWDIIKLDEIGIPFRKDHAGVKIVLTSRSKNVCNQMDCQKIFTVGTLSEQESWILFKEHVGIDIEDSSDMSSIAREITARCAGLPIAIVTIAQALKNKNKHVWSDAARQLRESSPTNIEGIQRNVISSLELSYNYLESEEAKSLFLLCSLFPKDFSIPIEDLMRYGVGLRLFKNVDTMDDVRDRAHAVVSTLTSSFLLIGEKYFDNEYVKMHDVVRDFALVIASKYKMFMIKPGIRLQEWPSSDLFENLTAISLMSNDIKVVPQVLECPNLQTLLLQGNSKLVLPTTFFWTMKDLKVLDLSETKLLSLPDSFSMLVGLRILRLNSCKLGDLSIIGKLKKLEILSLRGSNIEEIPTSFSQLNNLRLLDLSWCINLNIIPHSVIPCLHKLEELYLRKSFKHLGSEKEGDLRSNAGLVDLQALSRLTTLHISIPNPDLLSDDILLQSLTNFLFEIGHENELFWYTSKYSRNMSLTGIRNSKQFDYFRNLLKITQNLLLCEISGSKNVLHDLVKEKLSELKSLTVYSCEELIKVFSPALLQSFISLEEIEINACNNLQEIFGKKEEEGIVEWKKDDIITSPSLGNLTYIRIFGCKKLKNLFTPSIAKSLVKLRTLELSKCTTMQEVVTNDEGEKAASIEKIVFPNLYEMELSVLDSLTCFGSGLYTIEFLALEKLEIWDCPNLKTFGYRDQVTPKLNEVWIDDENRWNGNLNATVKQFFNEQGSVISSSKFSGTSKLRQSNKKEIMEALNDDRVSMIGIFGMGGVGKTTMVKEIIKQAKESKLFDAVVMAAVSHSPNILNIQGEIAHMLGLRLTDNSKSARARSLWSRIKEENKILIVLDNVCGRIELGTIGIPFKNNHEGCKIVLTSRSKTICNEMDCQKIFSVETLSKRESWVLFRKIVGPQVNPIAREIVARCDGLPIAIVSLAGTLQVKNKPVSMDAIQQLEVSSPIKIEGVHENAISSLELSFNYLLSEEEKSMLLFCCLFPEDFKIPVEVLVRYGMGLGWFKDLETMEDVRFRTRALVSNLTESFLLTVDKNYNDEECVKMHDVIRDFALAIAPKYNHVLMVKADIRLQEWPIRDTFEDLTCISLMSNDIREVPEGLVCPKLHALLLQQNFELVIPTDFFSGMKDLRVLDLSKTQLLPLPTSLSLLANIRTLYLNNCTLGDLSVIGSLSNLEILSFSGSNIKEIPTSFTQLSHLRLLDLNQCRELSLISCGVISCLHKLEELYMIESFRHWDSGSNAALVELKRLSRLTSLQISIPKTANLPNYMPFQNLSNFILEIGLQDDDWNTDRYSRNMMLSNIRIAETFDWVKNLLKRSENLFLCEIPSNENVIHDLAKEDISQLKSLTIKSCEIQYLQNVLEWKANLTFHNLEELCISKITNLVEICHGQPPVESFSKLKILEVNSCNGVFNIVPSHLLSKLQNLETFKASACKSVAYIFDFEGLHIANGETKLFSSLKDLELIMLPKMTHVWKGDNQFVSLHNLKRINLEHCLKLVKLFSPTLLQSLTSLKKMEISYCSNLEQIFGTKEDDDLGKGIVLKKNKATTSPNLGNLTYIAISYCCKLKNVFNLSIVKSLVRLRILKLSHCSTILEIVTDEEGENGALTERIVFPSLYYMELEDLESLTCFYSGLNPIEFLALETLMIFQCPKMKNIAYGDRWTPKLNKVCAKNVGFRISPISN